MKCLDETQAGKNCPDCADHAANSYDEMSPNESVPPSPISCITVHKSQNIVRLVILVMLVEEVKSKLN